MFQNAFQSGNFLEIFDPKEALNKSNKEREKFYQQLYKVNTPPHCQKVFDKQMKSYIFEIDGHNTKLQFPTDKAELCLVQQFLVFQLNIPQGQVWTLELVLTDTSKTKRRIMLTSTIKQLEKKVFHLKVPIDQIRRGVWLNLSIDVWSFMEGWKGQTFRSLDMIIINSPCKLRKIYSMRSPLDDMEEVEPSLQKMNAQSVPKQVNFPIGFPFQNQLVNYRSLTQQDSIPESIDIAASLSIPEEQSAQQWSTGNNKQKMIAQTQTQSSQQKNGAFKRKTLQTQEKGVRLGSVEKIEPYHDTTPQKHARGIPNRLQRPQPQKQQQQVQQSRDFQEVEENIEGEDFDNEFEQADGLTQFQQQSQNDEFDIIGQKIHPTGNQSNTKYGPQKKGVQSNQIEIQGSQTGLVQANALQGKNQTGDIKKSAIKQQVKHSPPNDKDQVKRNNPWGQKGVKHVQDKTQTQQEIKVQKENKLFNQSNSPDILNVRNTKQNSDFIENGEHILDVQQTQKKPFVKGKQAKPLAYPLKNKQVVEQGRSFGQTPSTDNTQHIQGSKLEPSQRNSLLIVEEQIPVNEYYQLTQKFTTLTGTKNIQFTQDNEFEESKDQYDMRNKQQEEEIEENIEVDNTLSQKNQQEAINREKLTYQQSIQKTPQNLYSYVSKEDDKKKKFSQQNFNKRSISELKPLEHDSDVESQEREHDELEDSLEKPAFTNSYGHQKQVAYTYSQNKWKMKQQDESETTFTDGFYANQLKKYTEVNHRPFTPDYDQSANISHLKQDKIRPTNETIKEEDLSTVEKQGDEQMVEVVYDPVMGCYYDPQTNQYYELND